MMSFLAVVTSQAPRNLCRRATQASFFTVFCANDHRKLRGLIDDIIKRKLHHGLKIFIKILFPCVKDNTLLAGLFREILILALENKNHGFTLPNNAL